MGFSQQLIVVVSHRFVFVVVRLFEGLAILPLAGRSLFEE